MQDPETEIEVDGLAEPGWICIETQKWDGSRVYKSYRSPEGTRFRSLKQVEEEIRDRRKKAARKQKKR